MARSVLTLSLSLLAAFTAAQPAAADPPARGPLPPSTAEMAGFVAREWPFFAHLIQQKEGLAKPPARMTAVPHTLCAEGYDKTFWECATLVVYETPAAGPRSALVRHDVGRGEGGQLEHAIVLREPPVRR